MKTYLPLPDPTLAGLLTELASKDYLLLETTRITHEEHLSLLFSDPVTYLTCKRPAEVTTFLQDCRDWLDRGYHLAGWLSYELGYLLEPALRHLIWPESNALLAELGVYRKPVVYDHHHPPETGIWPQTAPPPDPDRGPDDYRIDNLRLNVTEEEYTRAIEAIKGYIAAGDTYQVNYTLKLLFDIHGSENALYRALRRNQSVSFGAFIKRGARRVMSFSPELFFRKKGRRCTVRPMKGTLKRGRTVTEDGECVRFLQTDIKNRSENVMIVDLLRNDLGRLARPGTVKVSSLFDVETYETLHQMTSTIAGELPDRVGVADLFYALFPCGSVTGAPKIRTMEIIRELEKTPRGIYTGAIGHIDPRGDAVFNVPIRTVVLENGRGEMGIGSGIVFDSDAEKEWQECRLKAHFLTRPRPEFELIETILWQPESGFWLIEEHLARLAESARYHNFYFDSGATRDALAAEARSFAEKRRHMRVRVLLAKDGTVRLSHALCAAPKPGPAAASTGQEEIPPVTVSDRRTDSRDPFLYHKTTLRDFYNREREAALAKGYYEVFFRNERGEITEGSISTVFIEKHGIFFTPPLHCGLLPGVFRASFLKSAGQDRIREKVLYPGDLARADAVYAANSVRGMVRVRLEP